MAWRQMAVSILINHHEPTLLSQLPAAGWQQSKAESSNVVYRLDIGVFLNRSLECPDNR